MILGVIPVLPPDLRPLVPLEGGRFATSDLNDLYRRVINRNNRLKKLIDIRAPEVILRNEKRMLQEAVDALFDNGRRSRAVRGQGNRPLKSLSDMLKGQAGPVPPEPARQARGLLGPLGHRGRPRAQAPPVRPAEEHGARSCSSRSSSGSSRTGASSRRVKSAKRLVERERPEVWDILGRDHHGPPGAPEPRARRSTASASRRFEPVLVEGKAIRIHPMVCAGVQRRLRRRPDGGPRAALVRGADRDAACSCSRRTTSCLPSNGRPGRDAAARTSCSAATT